MLKIAAVVSLMLIVTWSQADIRRHKKEATASGDYEPGSTLWAAGLSCDSCGSECASACGTRHFRSCCFNYLRRKRGPEIGVQLYPQPPRDFKEPPLNRLPFMLVENIPEPWFAVPSDFKPQSMEDSLENRLPIVYDA